MGELPNYPSSCDIVGEHDPGEINKALLFAALYADRLVLTRRKLNGALSETEDPQCIFLDGNPDWRKLFRFAGSALNRIFQAMAAYAPANGTPTSSRVEYNFDPRKRNYFASPTWHRDFGADVRNRRLVLRLGANQRTTLVANGNFPDVEEDGGAQYFYPNNTHSDCVESVVGVPNGKILSLKPTDVHARGMSNKGGASCLLTQDWQY